MDQDEIAIKHEMTNQEECESEQIELKLEEDVPEYVNVNLFSSIKSTSGKTSTAIYQCDQCPSKYKKMECLTIHYAIHSGVKSCPICHEKFSCKKQFKYHLNQHIKYAMDADKKLNYTCEYCQKNFNCRKSLVIHTRVHTNERPYKCEICGESFKQMGSLKVHYVTHTKEKPFKCEICNGSYTTASSLRRHKRGIHEKGKVLSCARCDAKMYNMADLRNHRMNLHPNTVYKRTCSICSNVFFSKVRYRQHIKSHDNQEFLGKTYVCSLCGVKFSAYEMYVDHIDAHLGYSKGDLEKAQERRLFKCKLCPMEVKLKSVLFKHMATHMDKKSTCEFCDRSYSYFKIKTHVKEVHHASQCPVCDKVLSGKHRLRYHYARHHPSVRNKFICHICGQQYMMKYKLNLHIKQVHKQQAIKNYKCKHCGKKFLTSLILSSHLTRCHQKQSKLKCSLCHAAFNTHKQLLNHKLLLHKRNVNHKNWRPLQDKPLKHFRCETCKKIFRFSKNYETHKIWKTCIEFMKNIRYKKKCDVCFKYLANDVSLRRHMKLHSDCEYSCRICGKMYKLSDTLRWHMKCYHPDETMYWCYHCSEGFDKRYQLINHNKVHEVKEEFLIDEIDNVTDITCDSIKTEPVHIKDEHEGLLE